MSKIIIEVVEDSDQEYNSQTLLIDGKESASVSDLYECPEDAIIGRDLVDCHDIVYWIKYGYNIGRNGDEIVFE